MVTDILNKANTKAGFSPKQMHCFKGHMTLLMDTFIDRKNVQG